MATLTLVESTGQPARAISDFSPIGYLLENDYFFPEILVV
jgi:hypothetical protein